MSMRGAGGAHSFANDSDNCHCAKPKAKLRLCNWRGEGGQNCWGAPTTFSRVLFWVPIMIASDSMLMPLTSGKGSTTSHLCKSWANTVLNQPLNRVCGCLIVRASWWIFSIMLLTQWQTSVVVGNFLANLHAQNRSNKTWLKKVKSVHCLDLWISVITTS